MKYIRNTTDFYIEENTVLSLGKFDGIHRGHEQLLQYFAKKKDEGLAGAIFTFDIPPRRNVQNVEALASVIGEDELSPLDKKYLVFGREFEHRFVGQDPHDNRNIITTLDIGWQLLGLLPKEELDRIDTKILAQYYKATKLDENGDLVDAE